MMDDTLKLPQQLPSSTHEVIVVLDEVHFAVENIDTTPRSHEIISYHRIATADDVRSRIQCASIVIATQAFITAESLGEAPYLKCIITPTSGTNHIDVDECRRRGVRVAKCPGSTSPAVAEHALSLYFAARRKTVQLHNDIRAVDEQGSNAWKRQRSVALKMQTANKQPPPSIEEEVVGIIGHGNIGKRLETFCKALGMTVLIASRKGAPAIPTQQQQQQDTKTTPHRTPFTEVLRKSTILFLTCVSNASTKNLLGATELHTLRPEAVIINVARGNVLDTEAAVQALREQRISGVAVDVYDREPASGAEDSLFLAPETETEGLNLTFSPHVGYFSTKTVEVMKRMVRGRVREFVRGEFGTFEA